MTAPVAGSAVGRRIVLFAAGYEALTAEGQWARLAGTLARAAAQWGISIRLDIPTAAAGGKDGVARIEASGPGWKTSSEIRLLAWDEGIRADLAMAPWRRFGSGIAALMDVIATGTLARYLRVHWRYALFALYPIVVLLCCLAAATAAGVAGARLAGGLAGIALWLVALLLLIAAARRWLRLDHLLADWIYAMAVVHGRRSDHAALIHRFAGEIIAATRQSDVDEVLLVGHSLGAALAIEALAEAMRRDAALLRRPHRFALVGLGSSSLKLALHPAAAEHRAALAALAAAPDLVWVEYASRRDVLSFERACPIATLGLPGRGPRLERIHPRDMVAPRAWRRMARDPLRLHRQYVMGNDRRYFYDFALLLGGPIPVASHLTPDRALRPDGSLAEVPLSVPQQAVPA